MFSLQLLLVILLSQSSFGAADANSESKSSGNDTVAHNGSTKLLLLEHANAGGVLDDSNFKTLIRHCLKSQVADACSSMAFWNISRVQDCSLLFYEPPHSNHDAAIEEYVLIPGAATFNVDISNWDTSSCTNMHGMLKGAESFDQSIGHWRVQKVTDMSSM